MPGYWLNTPTFDKTLYKLNDGRSCEVALKYERAELKRTYEDYTRVISERNDTRAQFSQLTDQYKADQANWQKALLDEKNRHLKTTIRLGGLSIGLALTTWILGKTGVL